MKRDLLIGLLLAALLVGPSVAAGGLAGSGGAEVYGHAWVQWWAAQAWPAWPSGTNLAEGTRDWTVIDPLPTWIVAGFSRLIGARAAWNLWVSAGIVLAAVGGGALARAAGGSGVYGAVGVATMPIFLGSLTSGLTEDFALGGVALALSYLLGPHWRQRLAGGALLGLCAWFGLYLAWLGAWAALAIGVREVFRSRALRSWIFTGTLAAAIASPAAWPFRARLGGEGHHAGSVQPRVEPLWRLAPWRGADLAAFGAPGKVEPGGAFVREHPVYLGYATIGLAAAGGWTPAWVGVLACAAVAPGEHLAWAGQPLSMDNPAIRVFRLLPFAERFNHHARVMLLGQLILVILGARGVRRIQKRLATPAILWAGVSLLETASLSAARLPLPTAIADSPMIYASLHQLPPGPVAVIGAAGPGIHPQRVFFDQRAHGRALLHNPNRPIDGTIGAKRIVVALGAAVPRVEAELGTPDVRTGDGAAWVQK